VSWPSTGADLVPEPDAGYEEKSEPIIPFGKSVEVAKTGLIKHGTMSRHMLFCMLAVPGALKFTSDAVVATVGWDDFTPEEALLIGHRILTMERIFNMLSRSNRGG